MPQSGTVAAAAAAAAQDYAKLLGGIIRIVPRLDAEGDDLPADNPFLGDGAKAPELWAKGLRNPWGFWRDPATGELWMGDVGENTVEELNRIPAGAGGLNLGWYFIEGTQVNYEGAPEGTHAPIFTYRHDEIGPAIIGGEVYRGSAIPELRGAYVFADLAGTMFAVGAGDTTVKLALGAVVVLGGRDSGTDRQHGDGCTDGDGDGPGSHGRLLDWGGAGGW